MTERGSSPATRRDAERFYSILVPAVVSSYLFLILLSLLTQSYYYCDGAYNLSKILENSSFFLPWSSRLYAAYATQFLPVAAIALFHSVHYTILSFLYGINLYLPQLVSVLICYRIARESYPDLMLFPLLSIFGVSFTGFIFAVMEIHVQSSIIWPILFYLLLKQRYLIGDACILLLLSLVFMRSYESAVFSGPVLVAASLIALRRRNGAAKLLPLTVAGMAVAGIAIALNASLYPSWPPNRDNFARSIFLLGGYIPVMTSFIGVCVIMGLLIAHRRLRRSAAYAFPAIACMMVATIILLMRLPLMLFPIHAYHARAYIAYTLPVLGAVFLPVAAGWIRVPEQAWRPARIACAALAVGQMALAVIIVSHWDGFRKAFVREITRGEGLLLFRETIGKRRKAGDRYMYRRMAPKHVLQLLSLVWSPGGDVGAIIYDEERAYHAFNPSDPRTIPDFERYGIFTRRYRHWLARRMAYRFGAEIFFGREGNSQRYMTSGWCEPEPTYTWTRGGSSSLTIMAGRPSRDLVIEAALFPFTVPPKLTQQRLKVYVNDALVGADSVKGPGMVRFRVPRDLWPDAAEVTVKFVLPDAAAPVTVGLNEDTRELALGMQSLTIRETD